MYNQTIDLDLSSRGVMPVVYVSQYDNHLSALTVKLYNENAAFNVPAQAAVIINGLKPDGHAFSFASRRVNGNTVIFDVDQQMTAAAGDVICELRIRTSSEIIGTVNFILNIEEAPLHDDSVVSDTMIPLIEQAVDITANLAEYIEMTVTAAADATNAASTATSAAAEASVYNANVESIYGSLEQAKQNANAAAAAANAAADTLDDLSATANTLAPGSDATASYDSSTGVMTFGIPRGATGESGIVTPINGLFAMSVEPNGDLYVYSDDSSDIGHNFEYDSETGDLNYVFNYTEETTGEEEEGDTDGNN